MSGGSIHTHGGEIVHVHPQSSADEGNRANLAAFFRSVGGSLTNTAMTMPGGETYTNGDAYTNCHSHTSTYSDPHSDLRRRNSVYPGRGGTN